MLVILKYSLLYLRHAHTFLFFSNQSPDFFDFFVQYKKFCKIVLIYDEWLKDLEVLSSGYLEVKVQISYYLMENDLKVDSNRHVVKLL